MSGVLALLAAGGGFTLSISPSMQAASGTTQIYTFAAETVTVGGAVSPTYVWSMTGGAAATWIILSGQGTASCVVKVSNMLNGLDDNVTLTCTVTSSGVTKTISAFLSYININ